MRATILFLFLAIAPAMADQVAILPASTQVEFRAYGLGLLPFDGNFTRFQGILRYDPGKPGMCQIMLGIEATSLQMSNAAVAETILGPEFMDVAHFPDLAFEGTCQGDGVVGSLRLHGQTHPFALELTRAATSLTATGRLRRADWGITARPFTAGSTIRIRVVLPNLPTGTHT